MINDVLIDRFRPSLWINSTWYPWCFISITLRDWRLYSIFQEICTRILLCCALLWLYIDWFSHIHQAYFTGTGNLPIAPVPAKQPWWIWINTSCEFIMNDCITTTKQSTTKPCAYFLWYTVYPPHHWWSKLLCETLSIFGSDFIIKRNRDKPW